MGVIWMVNWMPITRSASMLSPGLLHSTALFQSHNDQLPSCKRTVGTFIHSALLECINNRLMESRSPQSQLVYRMKNQPQRFLRSTYYSNFRRMAKLRCTSNSITWVFSISILAFARIFNNDRHHLSSTESYCSCYICINCIILRKFYTHSC